MDSSGYFCGCRADDCGLRGADRLGFARSLRWALLVEALGVALPAFSTSEWSLVLSSIVLGSMAMGVVSLAAGRVSELAALPEQKQAWSWMTTAFSVAYAGGGWGLSLLFARTRSYGILFEIGATALVAGSLLEVASSRMAPATSFIRAVCFPKD